MFKKVLIANRGEIALRVIRACRELGIASVSVHSEADRDALHVRFADQSVCIGPPPSKQSYLSIPSLLSAAEVTGADAVHPGYGFLSENAEFAAIVGKCGLTWIGPSPEVIAMMGDKVRAREVMQKAGVPILAGTGVLASEEEALAAAADIGYPVLIKACAGGGGRGMKVVDDAEKLPRLFAAARTEAKAAFANGDVYLERYVLRPRHIEVQVFGDAHGHVIHLLDRECSVQRRNQKLVEEAPSCGLDDARRQELCELGARAARSVGYTSAGTLEFLFDPDRDALTFMEMNTRIQVEHTVTEMITGLDLVKEQIKVAAGLPLAIRQQDVRPRGWAIEVRINAEDPRTFAPSPGRITAMHMPGGLGVRVDKHIYTNYVVPPHYDSLLCKLIVHADDRAHAIARLKRALAEVVVEGISTNVDLFRRLVDFPDFVEGRLDTHLIERLQ